jgi:hypothetical protein
MGPTLAGTVRKKLNFFAAIDFGRLVEIDF